MRLRVAISLGDVESKTAVETVTIGHPTQVVAVNPLHNTVYVGTTAEAGLTVIPL
jgi:hypothetical protein